MQQSVTGVGEGVGVTAGVGESVKVDVLVGVGESVEVDVRVGVLVGAPEVKMSTEST